MDLRVAIGTMHEALLKTGDANAEEAGIIVRDSIEVREIALREVLAQVRRDNSGHFFVSSEAENILRSAAKIADVPWGHIDPNGN